MKRYKAIAAYYDAECAHHDMLREDVPFLLSHLSNRRQSILELATGTGRAAIPLAQAGHRVVGVDYDEKMLAIARRNRDSAGISDRHLSLIHGDILHLNLKEKFDWVVLLFNTLLAFPTLEEQDALLRNVVKHLKKRGKFWLDIFQPNLALIANQYTQNLDPILFHIPECNRTVHRSTSVRCDAALALQRVTYHYAWCDSHGKEHRRQLKFELTYLFPRELRMLLERNGLEIEKMYGNYDGSPLTGDSPRMIALCRHLRRPKGGLPKQVAPIPR